MSFICRVAVLFLVIATESWAMDAPQQDLDPSQRPESLKQDIQRDFDRISSNLQHWHYNGSTTYGFLQIDAKELAKAIIKTAPSTQKDFYFLDIGAGQFNWGIGTALYLNKQMDLPDDVTIHIVSVTGENYGPFKIEDSGRCKLYNIGAFKIEDLKESFKKLDLDFNGKFDLIVSQYTFIHLHDPVGTFVQAYDLLRSGTGLMLMEGLPVYFGLDEHYELDINMVLFLSLTKAPFLIGRGRSDRGIVSFLLRRPDDSLLDLPLSYGGTLSAQVANSYLKSVAYFVKNKDPNRTFRKFRPLDLEFKKATFYGDKDLYEWVYAHYPYWQTITTSWAPLFVDDENSRIEHQEDPLFKAASKGDLENLKNLIEKVGRNVNEKDPLGRPLLFRAMNYEETLEWLLDQPGLNINAQDEDGRTALYIKAMGKRELPIVEMLIDHGADVNIPNNEGNTPLHRAISMGDYGSQKVKLLLEKGADPSIKNNKGQTPFELEGAEEPEIEQIIKQFQK